MTFHIYNGYWWLFISTGFWWLFIYNGVSWLFIFNGVWWRFLFLMDFDDFYVLRMVFDDALWFMMTFSWSLMIFLCAVLLNSYLELYFGPGWPNLILNPGGHEIRILRRIRISVFLIWAMSFWCIVMICYLLMCVSHCLMIFWWIFIIVAF